MPRPKGSVNKTNNKKIPEKIICQNLDCEKKGKEQPSNNFYNTNSNLLPKYPVCKTCVKKTIDINNIQTVYSILKDMNIAFIKDIWDSCCQKKPDNPFGSYITQINSLPQYRGFTWSDSVTESKNKDIIDNNYIVDFTVTSEMIVRWGKNHSKEDYMKLEDFYVKMKLANKIETPQDEFYLKKLATISVKMDEELESGNYGQAKALGDLFSKYMADSQFRAMDKTDADKTGGIRGFGMIYSEVEKDDFIPPWEHYRKLIGVNQDIVDKTIMHIENYILKLNKIETMTTPPNDTPKLELDEIDEKAIINEIDI
jgi:hypothetical protein